MRKYSFWNNKGGTGKTSLAFQSITMFAEQNPDARILVIDLCPQANLSELLLGGLIGEGSRKLSEIQDGAIRCSVGGYFQERLPAPYTMPTLDVHDYICKPSVYNNNIKENIDLVAGDALVELQSNAITTLANTQIPGTNTWLAIIDWVNDFVEQVDGEYTHLFVDANPSFSVYTQIAIASTDRMILPIMADDSSRRAVQNAIALVQGINLPSAIYQQHNFATQLSAEGRTPPKFHLFPKNRLTQYMGPASAYHSVLTEIDDMISGVIAANPNVVTFQNVDDAVVNIRDFQTTGVVAFAHGLPFTQMRSTRYPMPGRDEPVFIRADYLQNCVDAMLELVNKL
ncbi:ParA family protein [Vibrio parahaemolyticus]|nr:AAA family ATPase [Vibrio parahaemolyticus]EGR1899395.1 ParA family protein [Vibrio parahaemolyticus]EGR1918257.1 ParA family protein [Vibrio parahaemolyticus]EHU4959553.1 AAA family ATPase [Vibrio parahaemolyticus]EKA7388691.1 AAA family ATPase [Vibrio parahaemolyticus]